MEINQDREADEDGEVLGPLAVFWTEGHGYDPRAFIHAVLDYCMDEGVDMPRLTDADVPVEQWQENVQREGGIIYERGMQPPKSARSKAFAVTVLDLERPRRRSGTKCSVRDCGKPWSIGTPVAVALEPNEGPGAVPNQNTTLDVWFCREHRRRMPEPYYRMRMVPVGAVIQLPAPDEQEVPA